MEQNLHTPEIYDFRQHDRLWQRVNPALEPYPETAAETLPARGGGQITQPANSGSLTAAQESQLSGAEPNPCCMGSEAAELLEVLEGYIEEELEDQRRYLALARQAPVWARQTLREIAEDEGAHARRLLSARYLITGQCYRPNMVQGQLCMGDWCGALRQCYHEEACGGFNYARTADSTSDICLARLLNELSGDEYRHAERVMSLLERSLTRRAYC
mgnify:FL=1